MKQSVKQFALPNGVFSWWRGIGCPDCGNHSVVIHPGNVKYSGQRKTVQCAVCYAKYTIRGNINVKKEEV